MAVHDHVEVLRSGVQAWNEWRLRNPDIKPDLSYRAYPNISFEGADLRNANLSGCLLSRGRFANADLRGANIQAAEFYDAKLQKANVSGAFLRGSTFRRAEAQGAVFAGADVTDCNFVEAGLEDADLTGCRVYGISVWNARLGGAAQRNLIITPPQEPVITVDNLEMAQFLYLLLNNERIRHVIDAITSKVVLILGRFTPERKQVLDAIREELRTRNYTPVLFDFEKPASLDITETVSTLAHMSRFVIADITDAKCIPQELMAIVPNLPDVPVQPLILASQEEYGMFSYFRRYPWVLEPFRYPDLPGLLGVLAQNVIQPAEALAAKRTAPG